jgi:hypothetical protein
LDLAAFVFAQRSNEDSCFHALYHTTLSITFREFALGIDTNHGYAKTEVVNSEVAKQRTALEQKRSTLER